jgi:Zn-dependent peptidase ImmA (M78 family)
MQKQFDEKLMIRMFKDGRPVIEISERLNVGVRSIYRRLESIGLRVKGPPRRSNPNGDERSNVQIGHKLYVKQVREIKRLLLVKKKNMSAIGRKYGVSPSMIWRIQHDRRWRHV